MHQRAGNARRSDLAPRRAEQSSSLPLHGPRAIPLQQAIGNRALGRFIAAKLNIAEPDDVYEQQADRAADHVMRMPEPAATRGLVLSGQTSVPQVHRAQDNQNPLRDEEEGERKTVQAKEASSNSPEATSGLGARVRDTAAGQPLPESVRAFFEPRFQHDFSKVRIHTDAKAEESARNAGALAYTAGKDIVLASGQFAPETWIGRKLLAHELTHVVQQHGGMQRRSHDLPEIGSVQSQTVIQRAISPELDKIEGYLSYGIIDWAITDDDAVDALELLKKLPKYQQAVFVANQKYLDRLRDNLPKNRQAELTQIEKGVADIAPTSSDVDYIESRLSYGIGDWAITDADAVESLERLKKLPGPQLAVALGAINYDRLLDNLPDARKQELIDLVGKASPSTGGMEDPAQKATPGSILNTITFRSDHGVMKDTTADWSSGGAIFGKPDWFIDRTGTEVSHPISQTRDTDLQIDLNLNLPPAPKGAEPLAIEGKSNAGALNFNYTGTERGGLNRVISMKSTKPLQHNVSVIRAPIEWTVDWHGTKFRFAPSLPHTVFVTMDKPRQPDEVTFKRMARAVEIISQISPQEPHNIVTAIMKIWHTYDVHKIHGNVWEMADKPGEPAQCIDIVKLVMGLIGTVGCPGDAQAVLVSADPSNPDVPIETPWTATVLPLQIATHPVHKNWAARLLDSAFVVNMYEAALKFDYGKQLAYYPGGVQNAVFSKAIDVLHVFQCLAWIKQEGFKCRIMEAHDYPGRHCPVGEVHPCS